MKTYWSNEYEHGPDELTKVQKKQEVKPSQVSDHLIKVGVGKTAIFFEPTEYKITGFSLGEDELEILLKELRARK